MIHRIILWVIARLFADILLCWNHKRDRRGEFTLMNDNNLAEKIAKLRKEKGLTQSQLAEMINVSNKTISRWETGEGYPEITLVMPLAKALGVKPDAAAGHSLGEFSALVVAGALSFEDGLKLVSKRAMAMQAACEAQPGTMAAILGLEDHVVEEICASVNGIVVAANYNCPGQLVISGAVEAVDAACEKAKAAGARRALRLPVGGAFHSPLMEPAKQELEKAISEAPFQTPVCPIYQNVDAKPYTDPAQIKANLIAQLTAPVRWTYIVKNMLADGVTEFTELGPGTVLQGLIRKVNPEAVVESKSAL